MGSSVLARKAGLAAMLVLKLFKYHLWSTLVFFALFFLICGEWIVVVKAGSRNIKLQEPFAVICPCGRNVMPAIVATMLVAKSIAIVNVSDYPQLRVSSLNVFIKRFWQVERGSPFLGIAGDKKEWWQITKEIRWRSALRGIVFYNQ